MRTIPAVSAVLLPLILAACQQEQTETKSEPEPQVERTQTNEPAPAEEQTKTPEPEPQATAQDTENVTDKACLAAVTKETGELDVTVTSNEFSEANTLVMIEVGDQRAPWRCLVSNDGQVAEVSFEGDDSAGVSNQPMSSDNATVGSDVSQAAIEACLGAVSVETNENNVAVLSSEFSEANSQVMVGVGEQRAPWRCLVSNDGAVQEVMFTGDDSAGVPDQPQSGSDVSEVAINACLGAVSGETNENNVAVLSSEFSEANSQVMVGVGEQKAPWRCLVSNDGAVQEVMFTGDEGKL